tara:strand:+ start:256 stop:711 length:456 start_codon:yes stop_codon:yes gene_type:complete
MLNFLEKFKSEKAEPTSATSEEKNILIASLLIECAKEDGDFSDDEIIKIKSLLNTKLNIDSNDVNAIFDAALEITQDNVEIYSLTKDIRDNFSHEEILKILEYMWTVMLADGHVDDFEAALMRKIIGLFHLTGKDSSIAKENALNSLNNQS